MWDGLGVQGGSVQADESAKQLKETLVKSAPELAPTRQRVAVDRIHWTRRFCQSKTRNHAPKASTSHTSTATLRAARRKYDIIVERGRIRVAMWRAMVKAKPRNPSSGTPPPSISPTYTFCSRSSTRTSPPRIRRPHPLDPSFPPDKNAESTTALATPSVRHFARTQGVGLALLTPGSGKGGRVEKADVQAYLSASSTPSPATAQSEEDVVVEAAHESQCGSLAIPVLGYSTTLDITDLPPSSRSSTRTSPRTTAPYPSSTSRPTPQHGTLSRPNAGLPPLPDVPDAGVASLCTSITPRPSASSNPLQNTQPKQTLTIRPHADIALALGAPQAPPGSCALRTHRASALRRRRHLGIGAYPHHLHELISLALGRENRRPPSAPRPSTLSASNVSAAGPGRARPRGRCGDRALGSAGWGGCGVRAATGRGG
ncbi:hypothetical protein B0H12DRAFT_1330024 [Mycena haematopus]|nr:hypothetical protein B0H12DRAFT_1330024 [Mycena haematopus]